ncbi:type II secretion system protein [Sporosarcina sp. GW1-11]|uniref:type II secretion system protein n=1 Tax=Sporosarcina sp. GW1-11 TaxID=2899126 RepID=UPI00294D3E92|nr:type II secretion system protein [Sporosarcina sp. GW1-11]MDV6377895.1 type II secretion system protein [Sporosarcina sp. GW1-11]
MIKRAVKSKWRKEHGFTFLEILLVLSIVVIMTGVILPFSDKRLHKNSEEDALKGFIVAVHETQLYAITHGEPIRMTFFEDGTVYKSLKEDQTVIVEGQFPTGMRRGSDTNLKELYFMPNGNLSPTGKMTIITKTLGNRTISFQFERGRMIINE